MSLPFLQISLCTALSDTWMSIFSVFPFPNTLRAISSPEPPLLLSSGWGNKRMAASGNEIVLSETKICKRRAPASLLCGGPPGKANHYLFHLTFRISQWLPSLESIGFCFTQFRLRWMTGFVVRSNGVLLTFVYFYQLGETAWTSTLYFLTFTEVARFEINVETLLFACANFFMNWLW